jgi:type II secretion system protein I
MSWNQSIFGRLKGLGSVRVDCRERGFTLLEVLISLALLTISLTAMVSVTTQRADTLVELREKNDALTVAHNVLLQHYQTSIKGGVTDGKQGEWYWRLNVKATNNESIWRMDVSVSRESDFSYSQAQLSGFKWR